MKEALEFIVQAIAGPKVRVESEERGGEKIFIIRSPKEKIGLLVGKGGKTIRAVRILLGIKNSLGRRERYSLRLEEL